jgi:predicted metal-dependent hydrolase
MAEPPIAYQLVRSRRKTIALEIRPDGTVLVRAPERMSARRIAEFVRSRESWLRAHIARAPQVQKLTTGELDALTGEARADFSRRTTHWARILGVSYGKITIRHQQTRWGSCSGKGNLNFNCLLMLAPEPVRDYVTVHELCHRQEMNHSPAFWALVAGAMPDFQAHRAWLKTHGRELLARLPENTENS